MTRIKRQTHREIRSIPDASAFFLREHMPHRIKAEEDCLNYRLKSFVHVAGPTMPSGVREWSF